jgi:GNAT superfamily N-acetyltransferase
LIGKALRGTVGAMNFHLRSFAASDADWLVTEHGKHYTEHEGFDASFAPLVASILAEFVDQGDVAGQAGWIAHNGSDRLGSIFCVRNDERMAKLRLFFVVQQARGTGAAQALLDQCLQFARDSGYAGLTLWTHESHRAAGAIYSRNGLMRVDAKPVHSFGRDLIEETWQITF